jgi:NDP-sugar pyrophosphorylase family protein
MKTNGINGTNGHNGANGHNGGNGANGHNGHSVVNGTNGVSGTGRVIIQAGGLGTRLQPYTTILPKPLMPVLEFPILEIVIRQLVTQGFPKITITLGHLGHLIMAVVGDGHQWGAEVEYVWEDEPRGTIGAITLVKGLNQPFLVMNGDLLTDFDFRGFLKKHLASGAQLSVGVHHKEVPISLGVFEFAGDHRIVRFKEKPTLYFPCSMGIYAFSPELIDLVPKTGNFGFDDLMALCLSQNIHVRAHPFDGLWLDIGRPEDYANATRLFQENRSRLLPETKVAGYVNSHRFLRNHSHVIKNAIPRTA